MAQEGDGDDISTVLAMHDAIAAGVRCKKDLLLFSDDAGDGCDTRGDDGRCTDDGENDDGSGVV